MERARGVGRASNGVGAVDLIAPRQQGEKIWPGGAWRACARRVLDSAPAREGGGAVEVGDDARWAGPPL